MPADTVLDDDYVVNLLKRDAEANAKNHLTSGFVSSKRRSDAPKPNTRFLRNIVRDVDSHNAALKAKEEEDSRARLRDLKNDQRTGKRRRDGEGHGEQANKRRSGEREGRWASVLGGLGARPEIGTGRRKGDFESKGNRHRERSKEDDSGHHRSSGGVATHHHKRSREHRTEESVITTSRTRSRSPAHRKERRRRSRSSDEGAISRSSERKNRGSGRQHNTSKANGSDSDPLDSFLGPDPPPSASRPRGRGASKPSTIDSRFASNYDPKADVDLSVSPPSSRNVPRGRDDWDLALEAVRDRAKWKATGAERLRAAGFTEDEVKQWETGTGGEKNVEDVVWKKRGEGREWDRGKEVGTDGEIGLAGSTAEWVGRLKGN